MRCLYLLPLVAILPLLAAPAIAEDTPVATTTELSPTALGERHVRPGLLIVRVDERDTGEGRVRRVEVVSPDRFVLPPERAPGWLKLDADLIRSAPRLSHGYRLVDAYRPQRNEPDLRYFFYADLRHPTLARNWRRFYRTQQQELRNQLAEERGRQQWQRRKEQLLSANEQATQRGVELLRAGAYREALVDLTLAAELNHGDPACRIHLTQTRVALGHDQEAAEVLRRALELQPKLIPMWLGLETYYPSPEEFDRQVDALARRVAENSHSGADEYLLLGFFEFQRHHLDAAYAAFVQADRKQAGDEPIEAYLTLTKPAQR